MRKSVIILAILGICFSASAQKTHKVMGWKITKDVPLNELKINLPTTIFLSYPEISYERILNTDISVGASLGAGLDSKRYPLKFSFTPYFRWFFAGSSKSMERAASGFFIEVNGALLLRGDITKTTTDTDANNIMTTQKKDTLFGAGFGMAIGWKYLSKNNWVGDITYGLGRDFANDSYYPHVGISIGKRF